MEIKDINIEIVKKVVQSKREGLVNPDVKKIEEKGGYCVTPHELVMNCYPDERALEYIPIRKYETGYWLDRTNEEPEVKSFIEQWRAKGTRNATTTFEKNKKDDSSSGYSSGFVTDAENVSSKAEGETSETSGYESMDCEGPPPVPQQSPWFEDEGSSNESSRSGSSNSSPESDGENIGTKLRKRKSSWSEDESSLARKSLRSESSNSSSPRSDLFDSDSELCRSLDKAGISK